MDILSLARHAAGMKKHWEVQEACPPEFFVHILRSPLVAQLLWNRGLRTPEEIQAFLEPSWEQGLHDPAQFRHLARATEALFAALKKGERITIHGDYDADGVTGSAVLMSTIQEIERCFSPDRQSSVVDFYIPHRDKEGYGLHRATVDLLKERGTCVLITVDCGIACVEEIALARAAGIQVIVVDHHQFGETLPDAHLIHPGIPGETYPFKKLAAVGVAFKLATAFLAAARAQGAAIPAGWEKWLLDLVAIATVTDMVGLVGENRVLEKYGLVVLNKTRRLGLQALIQEAGLTLGALDTESIGFGLGPRLNAAGRMDHASLALRLLLAKTREEADDLAKQIESCNRKRQEQTREMMREAERWLQEEADPDTRILVLWNEQWSPALVGLVAGRLQEKTGKPAMVIGFHEGTWIGSGRSPEGFDATRAMRTAGEGILTRVGGHAQACGFALVATDRLEELKKNLQSYAKETLEGVLLQPRLQIDLALSLDQIDWSFWDQIVSLEPFGQENQRPLFLARRCTLVEADLMGSDRQHLRVTVSGPSGTPFKLVGFKQGERVSELRHGELVDVVFHLSVNEWKGRRTLEGRLVDFHCVGTTDVS